jgi:GrpB-like predicted nucleotidyltransferase (UPF0157 family)
MSGSLTATFLPYTDFTIIFHSENCQTVLAGNRGDGAVNPNWPPWAAEPVELVEADPAWRLQGEQERARLESLLARWLVDRIEHVGSTAVPGLRAKPIIDLQAPVATLRDSPSIGAALEPHGWHHVDPEVDQRAWRRFFVKVVDGRRRAHLHVMTPDSPRWHQQIAFRDALRVDAEATADYAALKRALATEYAADREAYSDAKSHFIEAVLHRRSGTV